MDSEINQIAKLDKILNYLNQLENKEITLAELIDELTNKKIEDAQNATQKSIQEEIEENKKLLMDLKENNLRKKKC